MFLSPPPKSIFASPDKNSGSFVCNVPVLAQVVVSGPLFLPFFPPFLAQAVGIPVGKRSGSHLAMTSVATICDPFPPPGCPLSTFLIKGVLRSKI